MAFIYVLIYLKFYKFPGFIQGPIYSHSFRVKHRKHNKYAGIALGSIMYSIIIVGSCANIILNGNWR